MPRWLYYLLGMAVIAPVISLIFGPRADLAIFLFSTIALIPLAAVIGKTTEDLEFYVGPIAGGLLNATFGNAPELIIGIFLLRNNLADVVQASITGSIISNSLLVLGSALALGGWRYGRQYFNSRDAGQYAAMLLLAVAGLLIPTTGALLVIKDPDKTQAISVDISVVLLIVYVLYLLAHVFHVRSERRNPKTGKVILDRAKSRRGENGDSDDHDNNGVEAVTGQLDPHVEKKAPSPKLLVTLGLLFIATIGTAINSEYLVSTIVPVTKTLGWSTIFVGLVIIPIVGNAAEHSSAIYIALRDRVNLSMAIAAGSSIQVATFVAPLLVIISIFFSSHMSLIFQPLELVILGVSALLFAIVSLDGESSWLAGVQLIAVYLIACIVFFYIPS
jgi:Ca2+:H+ antiporter